MSINESGRAMQHLIVQGFTLYTLPALVALRRIAPALLDGHAWAALVTAGVTGWPLQLDATDPLRQPLIDAGQRAIADKTPIAVCHLAGTLLALPLEVNEVRHAGARLEVANNLKVTPPTETLAAYPLEMLEAELRKRAREQPAPEPAPADEPVEPAPITVKL